MVPSQNYFDLVTSFEGLRLTAYRDETGVWTIGYGTITYPDGTSVREGDACTQDQAQQWLTAHTAGIQLPTGFTQQQYDSCLDFCYEEGLGAFNGSTLKKNILANADADTITADFCMWDKEHVNGWLVESDGILRRRKCEAFLCNNGVNEPNFFL